MVSRLDTGWNSVLDERAQFEKPVRFTPFVKRFQNTFDIVTKCIT